MITSQNSLCRPVIDSMRISPEEGLDLLKNVGTAELMSMADRVRKKINGTNVNFVHSLNINPTNVCESQCGLCAFWREEKAEDAYFIDIRRGAVRKIPERCCL